MSEKKKLIQLKPEIASRVETRNGSIYVAASPGQTIEVDAKQYQVAMATGHFKDAPKKA